jgi:hypothetical protein
MLTSIASAAGRNWNHRGDARVEINADAAAFHRTSVCKGGQRDKGYSGGKTQCMKQLLPG